ncbi:MAG: response regulator [Candidatus Saccharibacteria bacterium]
MKSTQILLVEDDKLLLQMYSQKLEREGIHIHCETNGKEAAEWLKTNTPSLVVLDILLPGINGLQLIKIIRRQEHLQNTRVIILTNLTEADTHLSEELRSSLNIAAYYVKSQIGPSELVKNLKALLQ